MITIETHVHVPGLSGRQITGFLATCDDAAYRRWWPGTHLEFHTVSDQPGAVGSVVVMDEWIGSHRVRTRAELLEHEPGRRMRLQMRHPMRIPVWLEMEFQDDAEGVAIRHVLTVGYTGLGRVLDPLLRLRFSRVFAEAMHDHVREEFPRLGDMLIAGGSG